MDDDDRTVIERAAFEVADAKRALDAYPHEPPHRMAKRYEAALRHLLAVCPPRKKPSP
jgi:hypothetical protein